MNELIAQAQKLEINLGSITAELAATRASLESMTRDRDEMYEMLIALGAPVADRPGCKSVLISAAQAAMLSLRGDPSDKAYYLRSRGWKQKSEVGWTSPVDPVSQFHPTAAFKMQSDSDMAPLWQMMRRGELPIDRTNQCVPRPILEEALKLACDRISDSNQTYEEANTAEGWRDVFIERVRMSGGSKNRDWNDTERLQDAGKGQGQFPITVEESSLPRTERTVFASTGGDMSNPPPVEPILSADVESAMPMHSSLVIERQVQTAAAIDGDAMEDANTSTDDGAALHMAAEELDEALVDATV